jgi:hypothetical protein
VLGFLSIGVAGNFLVFPVTGEVVPERIFAHEGA